MKTLSGCIIFLSVFFLAISNSQAKDITAKVIEFTTLDEKISAICKKYCEGNQKKGTLTKVTIEPAKKPLYKLVADANFLNKEVIGEGVELFGYSVTAEGVGTLNEETCEIHINKTSVKNDEAGIITKNAIEELSKTYKIENCTELTSDLSN